jgi:N-methylhydantoinase A
VAEMVRALRVVTVERGVDPRSFALLAFGGAGPLHATDIADALGMSRILCPAQSGVLAALGLLVSDRRRDVQRTVLLSGDGLTAAAVGAATRQLAERARHALGELDARVEATYEMRYRGQSFELAIPGELEPSPEKLRRAFEDAHQKRYGFCDRDPAVELVTIRITALTPGSEVRLQDTSSAGEAQRTTRRVWIDGSAAETQLFRGGIPAGTKIAGPAVVELAESTVFVAPGWSGATDAAGTVVLERRR